ncbi:ATP-binding protein [Adlercreutzia sp. ZJ473]|uniref:ATP-binding protein n=1 Tax=Adlercreutzia sp. ZJ473 TaxID=2722822 RepID=UPI001556D507|nr:ATP-binding protein [Adlercreutzia sp. ZJ473]
MNLGMETERVEHKRSTSELREGMESAASILNKHGRGTLYFGVRPSDGEIIGQDVSEKTLRDVSQAFTNRIEPRVYPTVERLTTDDGKAYVRAEFSGDERPYACDGRYRIRSADEDLPMSAAMLEEMVLERAAKSNPWDRRPSGKTAHDVDEEILRRYVERGVRRSRIPFDYTNARDVLSRLGLLCDDGTLTNAAAACFVPSRDVMLRMGVFADGKRVNILDNQQVTGTLFSMVDAAELYILNNIRRAFIIDGSSLHREEKPEVPLSAIREALFNAFCHRRYEDDAAVQVDIFWDSIDIYSPGLFPSGLTPEDYLSGEVTASKPRNQLLASTLYKSGDIETYGTGLRRIKSACDEQNVPVEVFQRGGSVHVRFMRSEGIVAANSPITADNRRQTADKVKLSGLAGNDRKVCEYLSANETASVTEMSEALGIPSRTLRDVMRRLAERELVISSGANKNRRYSLR